MTYILILHQYLLYGLYANVFFKIYFSIVSGIEKLALYITRLQTILSSLLVAVI